MLENQNSFSKEEKEAIRKEYNDGRQKQRLRGCYQKVVLDGIRSNNHRSYERAVWELMQNAGDLSPHAVIKMELSNDEFCFSHKGKLFDMTTLCNLVEQLSSKSEKDDNVGQYGTGFMVTYSLSREVLIKGDCEIKNKRVPLNFWLDRTYDDEEKFIEELEKELKSIDNLIDERYTYTPNDWTSFTYPLDPEKSIKIKDRIEKTIHLMPFVLVFNDSIAECSITSSGRTTKYTKKEPNPPECDETDGDKKYRKVVTQIEITEDEEKRTVEIASIESIDGNSRVIVPPLPSGFDAVNNIPSQFLFFPLLGTENFGINFIFHSSNLYPVGNRDSYQLPTENPSVNVEAESNERVLNEMIDMLFNYYRDNPSAQNLPLDFAEVSFKYYKEGDPITKEFYERLQKKFSDEFQEWRMIPTKNGYKSMRDADHPKVLGPEFYKSLAKEQMGKHLPVIQEFAASFFVIPQKDIVEWSKVVYGWNPNESNYYIKLEDICQNIKEKSEHLKDFLLYLKDLGEMTGLASQFPLIPNRKAELKSSKDLYDGKTITPALYEIASPIIGDKADKIVDEEYSDIVDLSEYTRKALFDDVKSSIRDWHDNFIRLHKLMEEDVRVRAIIKYCSAYKITSEMEGADKYRDELMPVICAFYNDVEYERLEIPSLSLDEPDLYGNAFDFLIDYTLLMISQKLRLEDNDNRNLLLTFLKKLAEGNDEFKKKIKDYAVIPNQLGELKKADELKLAVFEYKEEIIGLYKEAFSQDEKGTQDLQVELVNEDFKVICEFNKYEGKDVGGKIEGRLKEIDYKNNAVPQIIRNLDDSEEKKKEIWKEYFPTIEKKKQEIFFNLGTQEDREAIFRIQMKGGNVMQEFAKLAKRDDCEAILEEAIEIISRKQKEDRVYNFKLRIGKLIENEIRKEISNIGEFSVDDVQPEQDIVISYNGKDLYYIECKAKRNFSDPAHMSSPQIKKAVREKGRYALFCVDLTNETGCKLSPEASEDEVAAAHDDIIANTHVHTDIGERLGVVKTLMEYEKNVDSNEDISIDSKLLSCNIPKRVFNQGKTFEDFIQELNGILKTEKENTINS